LLRIVTRGLRCSILSDGGVFQDLFALLNFVAVLIVIPSNAQSCTALIECSFDLTVSGLGNIASEIAS